LRKGILLRVGVDSTYGRWNAPVDAESGRFVYVPIPEDPSRVRIRRPYTELSDTLRRFGVRLPDHLGSKAMHLDPDFEYLTYGDVAKRAQRIARLGFGDLIVFYAGLRDVRPRPELVYGIIGLFVIDRIAMAKDIPKSQQHMNAHTRRILREDASDLILFGLPGESGRTDRCIPIGSLRASVENPNGRRMYRVDKELLEAWGGLSVRDGYIQRSAVPPFFNDADRFLRWFHSQNPALISANN